MTTYSFPAVTPNASRIDMVSNTAKHISPINGAIQTIDRGGERWAITMTFVNLTGDDRAEMTAFLAKLNGQQHRFTAPNHAEVNRGSFGGTPLVAGGSQTGNTLNVDGCSLSVTNWIRAGDWFGVGDQLLMATADANSDGSGNVTISFVPRLRSSPADNAAVTTSGATGKFILSENGASWSNTPGPDSSIFSDLTLTGIEDIGA